MIENISDTARWVAVYRAMETERKDAIFRDPFARRLAGAKGEQIVREMKGGEQIAWSVIVRTALFDELILKNVARGIDMVIDLASGLDTRAWRLPLPASLRWVDVDLPGILQYKTDMLANERTVCNYEAVHADLTDAAVRRELFSRLGSEARNALVITEGLLIYLTETQVSALASDLHEQPSFQRWMFDLASPRLIELMMKSWGKNVREGNARFQFGPTAGTLFFAEYGWREANFRSSMIEAHRLKREMKMMWFWRLLSRFAPEEQRREMQNMYAVVEMQREP